MSAFLIAIEGVDGSGKTTQVEALHTALDEEGYKVVTLRPMYELVEILPIDVQQYVSPRRSATESTVESSKQERASIFMILATLVYSLLSVLWIRIVYRKTVVVCDRYFYQMFFDVLGLKAGQLAAIFPSPEITVVLDADINDSFDRLDQFDSQVQREYYEQVAEYYRSLSTPGSVEIVRANNSIDDVHQRIRNVVDIPTTYRVD